MSRAALGRGAPSRSGRAPCSAAWTGLWTAQRAGAHLLAPSRQAGGAWSARSWRGRGRPRLTAASGPRQPLHGARATPSAVPDAAPRLARLPASQQPRSASPPLPPPDRRRQLCRARADSCFAPTPSLLRRRRDLQKDPPTSCSAGPAGDDLFHWCAVGRGCWSSTARLALPPAHTAGHTASSLEPWPPSPFFALLAHASLPTARAVPPSARAPGSAGRRPAAPPTVCNAAASVDRLPSRPSSSSSPPSAGRRRSWARGTARTAAASSS